MASVPEPPGDMTDTFERGLVGVANCHVRPIVSAEDPAVRREKHHLLSHPGPFSLRHFYLHLGTHLRLFGFI